MDHSSEDIIDIFFSKSHSKEPKELAKFLQVSFSNPRVPPSPCRYSSKRWRASSPRARARARAGWTCAPSSRSTKTCASTGRRRSC